MLGGLFSKRVVPEQVAPMKFFSLLNWLDGRPLVDVLEPYRQQILIEALATFRPDGSPLYRRVLTGRAKKNSKTTDAVLAALYKLLAWVSAGHKGNQVFFVASDLGQADDDLDLAKKLIRCNPVLEAELTIMRNVVERQDGKGFLEILPAQDAPGLHGKTYLFLVVDELHTQKDYRLLEALEVDRTRPDAMQWFASYAAVSPTAGVPINDLLKQHHAKSDPRLYVSWYAGTIEEANPSLNGPLGPTMDDILDAQRSLPSWVFRRLYQNLPGQPDHAAYDAEMVQRCVVAGRTVCSPESGTTYTAFCDMSGGGADDATVAVAHRSAEGHLVLDLVLDQGPRRKGQTFSPQQTVTRFVTALEEYGCHAVTGDRYAGEWPRQAFQQCGIVYRVAPRTRSEFYAALEPKLNSGTVELLDQPTLLSQLIGLVRKGEKIDHAPGEHDDHANSAAGALVLAAVESAPLVFYSSGRLIGGEPVAEERPIEAPSLVHRAVAGVGHLAEVLGKTVARVTDKLAAAGQAVVHTVAAPAAPRPHVRSIQEIEGLSEGARSPDEQRRLDAHYAAQARKRQVNEFEEMVGRRGPLVGWFPGDSAASAPTRDTAHWGDVCEAIRQRFQAMKGG